jgi:hypothetical protein
LIDCNEIEEPIKFMANQPPLQLMVVTCQKQDCKEF